MGRARTSVKKTHSYVGEDDFGVQADELVTLLDEIFEDPDAKAVVFSQWLRTHDLIVRRIGGHGRHSRRTAAGFA